MDLIKDIWRPDSGQSRIVTTLKFTYFQYTKARKFFCAVPVALYLLCKLFKKNFDNMRTTHVDNYVYLNLSLTHDLFVLLLCFGSRIHSEPYVKYAVK